MPVYLSALGTALPPYRYAQQEIEAFMAAQGGLGPASRRLLHAVYSQSGVEARHSVLPDFAATGEAWLFAAGATPTLGPRMRLYDRLAPGLVLGAAQTALAATEPSSVTHLITFSCTGMAAPGIDLQLQQALSLRPSLARTCINFMGCYAGVTALRQAALTVQADPRAVVLVAGVELCTLHFLTGESRDQLVANALFADGAAAAVVSARAPAPGAGFELMGFHSAVAPQTEGHMAWQVGDHVFEIQLSSYVPKLLESGLAELVDALRAAVGGEGFRHYAIHPGGRGILEAAQVALGLSEGDLACSYQILSEVGNLSSVTALFVLQRMLARGQVSAGEGVLVCAFGPGLTLESAALRGV